MGTGCKKADRVLGSHGQTGYQIIIPVQPNEALMRSSELIREAFAANGFELPVVTEEMDDPSAHGIYLGDTEFARANGIEPNQFKGWSYIHRVVGSDIIITGTNKNSRMGVVKGVCDFLREYAGTRFLYPGKTGTEFLNTPIISVPGDLDLKVTPSLKFNFGNTGPGVDFYAIANNQFPGGFRLRAHSYGAAVPLEKYHDTHPEYFALLDGKRIRKEMWERSPGHRQYCISNPEFQELILQDLVREADLGIEVVSLGQSDAFKPCECEQCRELYGTGDNWSEKLWIFHRNMAERLNEERPGTDVLLLSYQYTTHPPETFHSFPDNAIILLTHSDAETFEEWNRTEVPGGYAVYIYNWGTYNFTGYLPKKSPEYLERQTRRLYENHVTGIFKDGVGSCYGIEGPAYYVFGRMFDDPENLDAEKILEEYYQAAFGEAVAPMRRFFDMFYRDLELHSEWLTPRTPAQRYIQLADRKPVEVEDPLDWVRRSTSIYGSRGVIRFIRVPEQMFRLVFTPELLLRMEDELKQAESLVVKDKAKRRLGLVRLEFDYLKNIVKVINQYHAYLMQPESLTLDRLLAGIDSWNAMLDTFYDAEGRMKPLPGWPEIELFRGHGRATVGLVTLRHWPGAENNPFAWDTEAIRENTGEGSSEVFYLK
jgi:hypothetical protein